jgi:hypothetical protein
MLEIIRSYIVFVLAGRVRSLFSLELFIAISVSATLVIAVFVKADAKTVISVPLGDFSKVVGTYGALGMSTCLTTLALAARWSSNDFNDYFRVTARAGNRWASYSSLLFKLSWAAITHWITSMTGLLVSLFARPTWTLIPLTHEDSTGLVASILVVFLFTYCVMNFLTALLGVSVLCMIRKEFMDVTTRPRD